MQSSYIKFHVTTMLSIPTTWHRNAMTIDMVEIMTLRHPKMLHDSQSVVIFMATIQQKKLHVYRIAKSNLVSNK